MRSSALSLGTFLLSHSENFGVFPGFTFREAVAILKRRSLPGRAIPVPRDTLVALPSLIAYIPAMVCGARSWPASQFSGIICSSLSADSRQQVERKALLRTVIRRTRNGIQYVGHAAGDGAGLFEAVCKLGPEGSRRNSTRPTNRDHRKAGSRSRIRTHPQQHAPLMGRSEQCKLSAPCTTSCRTQTAAP